MQILPLILLAAASFFSPNYSLDRIKSKTVGDGQHGTARWATNKEIAQTYQHIPFEAERYAKITAKTIIFADNDQSPTHVARRAQGAPEKQLHCHQNRQSNRPRRKKAHRRMRRSRLCAELDFMGYLSEFSDKYPYPICSVVFLSRPQTAQIQCFTAKLLG